VCRRGASVIGEGDRIESAVVAASGGVRAVSRARTTGAAGGFVRRVRLDMQAGTGRYPFTLPAVQALGKAGGLALDAGVTFLVGENGTGKSTLVEALAVACGFNPEGGSQNFQFATRASESSLGDYLVLTWAGRKPRTGFFLRAESYYNVATEIERLDRAGGPPLLPAYGGTSPHERSHGESFVDLVTHRFGPNGLYLLDEPEAALSVRGCMAVLARLADLTKQGSQIVVATHSPVLLALPGATIYEIDEDGDITRVEYDQALPVRLTRDFLAAPERFLRHLLTEEG
jgi:predicted ATPase